MVDYIAGGYLEDLTAARRRGRQIEEDDVGAFFRDFSQKYGGKTYMITLDGDFHMMYYRTDVLEAAGKSPRRPGRIISPSPRRCTART